MINNTIPQYYFQAVDKNDQIGINATVVIVDKQYWDIHKNFDPSGLDRNSNLMTTLEKEKFYELQEGVYESENELDSYSTVREKMISLELIEKKLL